MVAIDLWKDLCALMGLQEVIWLKRLDHFIFFADFLKGKSFIRMNNLIWLAGGFGVFSWSRIMFFSKEPFFIIPLC